jgi:hypothetical protein
MKIEDKIIKTKLGLLKLAEQQSIAAQESIMNTNSICQ